MDQTNNKVTNPETGKPILYGGKAFNKLMKNGEYHYVKDQNKIVKALPPSGCVLHPVNLQPVAMKNGRYYTKEFKALTTNGYRYDKKANKLIEMLRIPGSNRRTPIYSEFVTKNVGKGIFTIDDENKELIKKIVFKTLVSQLSQIKYKNTIEEYRIRTDPENNNEDSFYATVKGDVFSVVEKALENFKTIKLVLIFNVSYRKGSRGTEEEQHQEQHHWSSQHATAPAIFNKDEVSGTIDKAISLLKEGIAGHLNNGSGWALDKINWMDMQILKYNPTSGATYIPLPKVVADTKSCINVNNEDNKCFKWAILSALHPTDNNAQRISKYNQFESELNDNGIEYPVSMKHYNKFERQNNICINVFQLEISTVKQMVENKEKLVDTKRISPLYISKEKFEKHVELLVYTDKEGEDNDNDDLKNEDDDGPKKHYVWIKNFSRLVSSSVSSNAHKLHWCFNCLQHFTSQKLLDNHRERNRCVDNESVKIILPKQNDAFLEFENYRNQLESPYVAYADFECTLIGTNEKVGEKTNIYQVHKANSVGVIITNANGFPKVGGYRKFEGDNCTERFLKYLLDQHKYIQEKVLNSKLAKPLQMTAENETSFEAAKVCHICEKDFTDKKIKVRDHDHLTGEYRGAAHSKCNIAYNYKNFKLPVVFHNLRGYDSHLIMEAIGKVSKNLKCIANTPEKYMSFTMCGVKFIDSLQFTLNSLENLVEILKKSKNGEAFKHFYDELGNLTESQQELLLQKGVYPYDWVTDGSKMSATSLPSKQEFFSKLDGNNIEDRDYEHAQKVWQELNCKTFQDYHDLYLKTDVLLLADVFENYRRMCMKNYGLDPLHYVSAPGLSWDAMLKKTGVKVQLFTDIDMLLFTERGMRGGYCGIHHRYATANNKYMQNCDSSKETNYLQYYDANNLYGWAMSQYMPIGEYAWEQPEKFDAEKIMAMTDEQDKGFIFDVDLEYPKELHDEHNDFPFCPEQIIPTPSPFMEKLGKASKTPKLIQTLADKKNYVVHYRNLRQALENGLKLTKIHQVLGFKQSPWLKSYIDFNTQQRAKCTNDAEKDFFKLMNNSIFGKTCENLRNRIDVRLVADEKQHQRLVNKPNFKMSRRFNDYLRGVEMKKTMITYNRPIIVGMAVLDVSKTLIYDFHYNTIRRKYGDNVKLLMTDTDSLVYSVKTKDIYEDMIADKQLYDFSDYDNGHTCFSNLSQEAIDNIKKDNKKVVGKFKDEFAGKTFTRFIGIRAKMYCMESETKIVKKAKGVKKGYVKKTMANTDYEKCINGNETRKDVKFNVIRAQGHVLSSREITKVGLCAYDDKRYVLDDGVTTLAHGHYKIIAWK